MFAEAVAGKKIAYLYRIKSKAAQESGLAIAFTTENSRKVSKDADSTATKDGSIRTPGTAKNEIETKSILAIGDKLIPQLEEAQENDEIIEIWEVNLAEPANEGQDKFKGRYFQGYLTEFSVESKAEDMAELSLTFGINGTGVKGDVTVPKQQQAVASYVFADTPKTGM